MKQIPVIISLVKSKKYYILIVGAIVIFLLLRLVLLQKPTTELTYTIKKENLVDTIQESGTYMSAAQTSVSSPTNGVIDHLFVSNNDQVKRGDPLFHIQSSATLDQQKAAYATYLAASSAVQADNATLYSLQSAMFTDWNTYFNLATNSTYQ